MKKQILCFLLIIPLFLSGCLASLNSQNKGTIGKASKATAVLAEKVDVLDTKKAEINDQRLTAIGSFSSGVEYSLQKDTNQSQAIYIARDLNERVTALANKPDFKDLQAIYQIIDTLITNQANGEKLLAAKDKEIYSLSSAIKRVNADKNEVIGKAWKQSEQNAAQADQYKATLNDMDSFFGFGAIWYGVKKLVTRLAWTIGICLVLFIILRFAAAANPIAGAIFSVFEQVVSWFIHGIAALAPKATQVAGFIEQQVFNEYKATLTHIVDAIQMAKENEKKGATISVSALTDEIAKGMDQKHKDCVTEIKRGLNWR